MIVLPAHACNLSTIRQARADLFGASQPACRKQREKQRHSDKNQNVDDWLAAVIEAGAIDVLDGNR